MGGRFVRRDLLTKLSVGLALFLLRLCGFGRVEVIPLLQFRIELLQLRVAEAAGMREVNVRGVRAGDDDIAVNLIAHLEHRQLLLGERHECPGQYGGDQTHVCSSVHAYLEYLSSNRCNAGSVR
jgi:hypothetical protein